MSDLFNENTILLERPNGEQFTFKYYDSVAFVIDDVLNKNIYPIVPGLQAKTIVDLGANIGMTSVYFASIYPEAIVYAFEPHPKNFDLLEENAGQFDNIRPLNLGASNIPGTFSITDGRNPTCAQVVKQQEDLPQIQVVNFGSWLDENGVTSIDILKVDTEGYEVPILMSAAGVLKSTKVIYVEYHTANDRLWIDNALSQTHKLVHAKIYNGELGELVYILA